MARPVSPPPCGAQSLRGRETDRKNPLKKSKKASTRLMRNPYAEEEGGRAEFGGGAGEQQNRTNEKVCGEKRHIQHEGHGELRPRG